MLRMFPRQPAHRARVGISPLAAARTPSLQAGWLRSRRCRQQLDLASSGARDPRRLYPGRQLDSRARDSIRTD